MAYWYTEKPDELLLDIDDYTKRIQRFVIWGEMFRQRLRDAVIAGKLRIRHTDGAADIIIAESNREQHFHVFIRLAEPMPRCERMVWQLRLGSDQHRAQADLMRSARGVAAASLLIRHTKIRELWREPDDTCNCTDKHDTIRQSELVAAGGGCPVWARLRGSDPWAEFGARQHDGIEKPQNLPLGRVPLEAILKVAELKTENF
jgi:hypothetical protein